MRFPLRRAVIVAGIAALVLVGVDLTLLHIGSSARSVGSGTAGAVQAAGPSGVAGSPASRTGTGSSGGPGVETGSSSTGRGRASTETGVAPVVSVAGAAALPSARVRPGYETPADAVDGFYQALLGGTPTQACTYVTTPCPSFWFRSLHGHGEYSRCRIGPRRGAGRGHRDDMSGGRLRIPDGPGPDADWSGFLPHIVG
jgi:hypothetical protein